MVNDRSAAGGGICNEGDRLSGTGFANIAGNPDHLGCTRLTAGGQGTTQ